MESVSICVICGQPAIAAMKSAHICAICGVSDCDGCDGSDDLSTRYRSNRR